MATIAELRAQINKVIYNIEHVIPEKVAESMMAETRQNFEKEEYGNDEAPQRWRDRFGTSFKPKKTGNVEHLLRYPKLRYSGRLSRSITPFHGAGFAGLRSTSPYAELHNTGRGMSVGGNVFRKPPKSSEPVRLGSNPVARQFMGVGKRTEKKVVQLYQREMMKLI